MVVDEYQLLLESKGGTIICGCCAKCLLHVLEILIKIIIPCFSFLLLESMCSNAMPLQLQVPHGV